MTMLYQFIKQRRTIKTDDSSLWVGGEIFVGQTILVRMTWFVVKNIEIRGNVKIITLTDKSK